MNVQEALDSMKKGQSVCCKNMVGSFSWFKGMVYFNCGEGCCDYDDTEADFLIYHAIDEFTIQ